MRIYSGFGGKICQKVYVKNINNGLNVGQEKIEYGIIYAGNDVMIVWILKQEFKYLRETCQNQMMS